MASSGFVRKLSQMGWKPKRREKEKEKEKPKTKKEGLMQDLEKERLLRAETEQRLAEMTVESETTKTRLQGLQDEFRRMEDMVRSMVQYKMKLDQLKQEKANLTVTYEDHIEKYKMQISNLEQENMLMMNKMRKMELQLNERPDSPEKCKLLMERLKSLEAENSALVLENETQRQSYEKCLDEIANQVVQALMTQKCLREECTKLQKRVFELESHNKQLQAMMQTRLRHSSDAAMIQVMSGKKLTKSRAKSLMLIEGSTQSLPGQRSFIPLRNSLHHTSKHMRHYSNSTFTGMEPNVDALPSSTLYDHDYNDNAYCDTPCMPQLSSPPPWLREKLKLIPLNDDTASDNAYQYHSNLDAESLTTKFPRSPKSETPAKSAESKIQQITSRLFTKGLQTDNVDKVLSSKGQHSNHSGYHSNTASCHSNHSACYSKTPGAQESSFRKQHTQNSAQKSQNFTLDINSLSKHNMKWQNGSVTEQNHAQKCLHPSPGRELLCMSDEFEMKFTANAPEGIPVLMKNYDTDDELSDDAESSSESSSDDQKQDHHSTCSSFSLNDILENGLDICDSPSDDSFSMDKYPLFLDNGKRRKGSLRLSSYDETFGETESLKRQIIQNCKATISTSKLSHSISDTNSVSRSEGNSSPLGVDLKRPISLDVLLESAVKREEEVLKIETEKMLSHDPVLTLKEDKSPPISESEEENGQRSEQISSDAKIREETVKDDVRVLDSVKHVFSSGNSDSAFEEQILSPGEDEEVSQSQAQEGKRNNMGAKSVEKLKQTESLKGIFVIAETSEKSPATERKKDGAVVEAEKATNLLQPIRLQVQVEGQRVLRSACSSPGSEYNYERSGSADDGYSTMASDVNPETLENFANAVKPGQLPKNGASKSDSATILRSNALSTETLKDIPLSRSNSKEEEEVFKEDVATIKRISLCELKEIKEETKESVSSSKSSRRSSEVDHSCEVFETIRRQSRAESMCSVASSASQASASSVESTSIGRVCDIKGYFEKEADKQRRSAESLKRRKNRPSSEPVRSVPKEADYLRKHKHLSEGGLTPTRESHTICNTVSEPSDFKIQRPNQIRCSLCRSPRKRRNVRTSPIEDCGPNIHSDTSLAFHQSDHGESHKLIPLERAFSDSELHNSWIDKALESPENIPHNHTFYKHLSVSDLTARFEGRVPGCIAGSSDSSLEGLDHILQDDTPRQAMMEDKQNVLLLSSDSDSDVDASINYVELWRKNHLVHMPVQLPQWDPKKTMDEAKKLLSPPTRRKSEVKKPGVKQPEVKTKPERRSMPASFKDPPRSNDQFAPPTPIGPKLLPKKRPVVPPRMKLDKLDPNVILANSPPRSPVTRASSLSSRTRPTPPSRTFSLSADRRSPSKAVPSKDQNGPTRSSLPSNTSSQQSPKKKVPPPVPKRTSSKLSMPNLSPINKLNGQVSKLPKEGVVYMNTQELKEEETREISRSKIPKFNAISPQTRIPTPKQGKDTQNMKIVNNSQNLEAHSMFHRKDVLPDLISPGCMAVNDYHLMVQNGAQDGVNMSAWNVEGCKARPCSYGSQPKLTVDSLQEIETSLTLSTEALLPIDTHFKRDFYSLCQVDRESNRSTPCNLSAAASLDKLHAVTMNGSLASLKNLPWKTNSDPNCSRLGEDAEEIDEISQQIADLSKTVDDLQKSLSSLNSIDSDAEKCDNVDHNDANSISWPEFTVSNLSSSLSSLDVSTASLLDSDASSDKYVWMDDDITPLYDEIHDDTAAFDASDEFDWMSFQPKNIRGSSVPRYLEMELEMELKESDEHAEKETTEFMDPETRDNILDAVVGTDSDDDDFVIGNDPEMREIVGKMPRRRCQKKGKRAVVRHAVHSRPHVEFKTFFRYEDAEKKALSHFNFLKKYLDEIEKGSNPGSPVTPDGDRGITDVSNRENIAPDHVPKEMPLPGVPRDLVLSGGGCERSKWSPEQVDPRLSPISENSEVKETKKTSREKMTAFGRLKSLSLDHKKDAKESLKLGKELEKKAKEEKKAKDASKPKLRFGFKGLNGSKRRASAPISVELVPPIASTSSETCVNRPKMTELEKAIAISTPDIRGDGRKGSKGSLERPGSPQFSPKDGSNVRKSSSVKVRKSSATKVFVKKDKADADVLDSHLLRSQSAKTARTAPKGKKTIADKVPSPKTSPKRLPIPAVQETPLKPVPTPSGGSPKRHVAKIDSRIPKSSKKPDVSSNSTCSSSPAASTSTSNSFSSSPPPASPELLLQAPDIVPRHQDIPLPPIPTERKSDRKQKTEIKKRAELKRKTEMKKPDVALKISDKKTDPKSPQKTSPTGKQSRLPVSAKDKKVVDTPLWAPPKGTAGGPPVKGRAPGVKPPEPPRRKSLPTTEGARIKSQRSKKIVDTELVLPPIKKDGNDSDMSHASSLSEEIFNQLSMSFDDRCKTILGKDDEVDEPRVKATVMRDPYLDNFSLSDSCTDSYTSSNDESTEHSHAVYSHPQL